MDYIVFGTTAEIEQTLLPMLTDMIATSRRTAYKASEE